MRSRWLLLEDERIGIDAISGTSANAANAVVLADGLVARERQGAREALRRFWSRVSGASGRGPMVPDALGAFIGNGPIQGSPMHTVMDWVGRSMSPHPFNPPDLDPLRDIVATEVDFEQVRSCHKTRSSLKVRRTSWYGCRSPHRGARPFRPRLRASSIAWAGRPNLLSQVAALRMQRIHAEAELAKLGACSKQSRLARPVAPDRIGYRAAQNWLETTSPVWDAGPSWSWTHS